MTYRTNDTNNTFNTPATVSNPVRNLRRRRYASALRSRSSGVSVSGFGI